MTAPDASRCQQCGAEMRCGAASGDTGCWCFEMPRVMAVPTAEPIPKTSCLCRACLEQLIDKQANLNDPKNL